MTYLESAHAAQVGQTTDLRVEWTFGNQMPDVVEIIWNVVGWAPESARETQVAIHERAPTAATITAAAPGQIQVEVFSRLLDGAGRLLDQMPDDQGVEQYWETYRIAFVVIVPAQSTPTGGGGETYPAPVITARELTPERLVVRWSSSKYDFFQVIWSVNGRRQPQAKIDSAGDNGYYVVERPRPNTTYAFQVQGCISTLTGSRCSPWSSEAEISLNAKEGWQPYPISPPGAARDWSPLATAVRDQQLDVFWIGPDAAIGTTWTRPDVEGGRWKQPYPISPPGAARDWSRLATAVRDQQLDVFWIGPDAAIGTTWTRPGQNWAPPYPITPPEAAREESSLAVTVRGGQLDAFWIGPDAAIGTTWVVPGQRWAPPYPITPPGAAGYGWPLAAAVRGEQLDVLWVGPDRAIGTTWVVPGQRWAPPYPITPPGASRNGSSLAAAVRNDQGDVFWIGTDGAIGSNYSRPGLPW